MYLLQYFEVSFLKCFLAPNMLTRFGIFLTLIDYQHWLFSSSFYRLCVFVQTIFSSIFFLDLLHMNCVTVASLFATISVLINEGKTAFF